MPKRTTLTYTSEDAPKTNEGVLYVYYCKYSGKHAFTIDCDINKLPRRRTDGARILDTQKHASKFYTTDGGMKLIRRHNGKIERQYRLNVGKLPVAYRSEENGQLVYIMDNAVSSYVNQDSKQVGDRVLVPPCIRRVESGATELRLDVEDKTTKAALVKISMDTVRIHIVSSITQESAHQEILQLFAKLLSIRITQMTLTRGARNRNRMLEIDGLSPREVFEKLQAHLAKAAAAATAQ